MDEGTGAGGGKGHEPESRDELHLNSCPVNPRAHTSLASLLSCFQPLGCSALGPEATGALINS